MIYEFLEEKAGLLLNTSFGLYAAIAGLKYFIDGMDALKTALELRKAVKFATTGNQEFQASMEPSTDNPPKDNPAYAIVAGVMEACKDELIQTANQARVNSRKEYLTSFARSGLLLFGAYKAYQTVVNGEAPDLLGTTAVVADLAVNAYSHYKK